MVFTKMNCPWDHAEGGQRIQGCGVIVTSAGTSNNAVYCILVERHVGESITVDGALKSNSSKIEEVPNPIPEDKTINLTCPIIL